MVMQELLPTVSTDVTLGTWVLGPLQTCVVLCRATSARQALLLLQAQHLALSVVQAFIQPLLVHQPAAYVIQIT